MIASSADLAGNDTADQLSALQQENSRLQIELKNSPKLTAAAAQLREQLAPSKTKMPQFGLPNPTLSRQPSNNKSASWPKSINGPPIGELAKQREAAETRLAEKASQPSANPEKEYAETKKHSANWLSPRNAFPKSAMNGPQLDKTEKRQIRPPPARSPIRVASRRRQTRQRRVLYQAFPLTNTQDPSSVVFLRSVIPDKTAIPSPSTSTAPSSFQVDREAKLR